MSDHYAELQFWGWIIGIIIIGVANYFHVTFKTAKNEGSIDDLKLKCSDTAERYERKITGLHNRINERNDKLEAISDLLVEVRLQLKGIEGNLGSYLDHETAERRFASHETLAMHIKNVDEKFIGLDQKLDTLVQLVSVLGHKKGEGIL